MANDKALTKVRVDKWLWAARFFKTRSLAKQAIDGGKVHVDGQRCKASKDLTVGMSLRVRQGWEEKEIRVLALSEQRRGAPQAAELYEETEESIRNRNEHALQRSLAGSASHYAEGKPTKKQRRQIHKFINRHDHDIDIP